MEPPGSRRGRGGLRHRAHVDVEGRRRGTRFRLVAARPAGAFARRRCERCVQDRHDLGCREGDPEARAGRHLSSRRHGGHQQPLVDHGPPERHRCRCAAVPSRAPGRVRRMHGAHGRHRGVALRRAARSIRRGAHHPAAQDLRARKGERHVLCDAGGQRARPESGCRRRARARRRLCRDGTQALGIPRSARPFRSGGSRRDDPHAFRAHDAARACRHDSEWRLPGRDHGRRIRCTPPDSRARRVEKRRHGDRLRRQLAAVVARHQLHDGCTRTYGRRTR